MSSIAKLLRQQIFIEADHRCAYCRTSHQLVGMPPVIDHIIPVTAGGDDEKENLAASCYRCNEFKGAKTHAIDPATGELTALYHPHKQSWSTHFSWANGGTYVIGLTPTGRATVVALRLNNEYVVGARLLWVAWKWHPPQE